MLAVKVSIVFRSDALLHPNAAAFHIQDIFFEGRDR